MRLVIGLSASVSIAQEAESYYVGNIETIVQSKCITCHRSGGQAGSTALRFTSSSSGNHAVFDSFVNSPLPGARATTVLNKISGQAGHGGGMQVSQGSSDYLKFSEYVNLLSTEAASEIGARARQLMCQLLPVMAVRLSAFLRQLIMAVGKSVFTLHAVLRACCKVPVLSLPVG